jgi:hypothetical protein
LSFYIPESKRRQMHKEFGPPDSLTAIIERLIVEEGMSIYDAALWQIVHTALGDEASLSRLLFLLMCIGKAVYGN